MLTIQSSVKTIPFPLDHSQVQSLKTYLALVVKFQNDWMNSSQNIRCFFHLANLSQSARMPPLAARAQNSASRDANMSSPLKRTAAAASARLGDHLLVFQIQPLEPVSGRSPQFVQLWVVGQKVRNNYCRIILVTNWHCLSQVSSLHQITLAHIQATSTGQSRLRLQVGRRWG